MTFYLLDFMICLIDPVFGGTRSEYLFAGNSQDNC